MRTVPLVATAWLVDLVNEYGTQPRAVAGESDQPFPDLGQRRPRHAARLSRSDMTDIADRLWPIFAAEGPAEKARVVNDLLRDAALTPQVSPQDGHVTWLAAHDGPRALVLAGSAVAIVDSLRDGGWRRLGICDADDCVDVHLDVGGRARRYCSPTCLNRSRIRAYRARQHQAVARP